VYGLNDFGRQQMGWSAGKKKYVKTKGPERHSSGGNTKPAPPGKPATDRNASADHHQGNYQAATDALNG